MKKFLGRFDCKQREEMICWNSFTRILVLRSAWGHYNSWRPQEIKVDPPSLFLHITRHAGRCSLGLKNYLLLILAEMYCNVLGGTRNTIDCQFAVVNRFGMVFLVKIILWTSSSKVKWKCCWLWLGWVIHGTTKFVQSEPTKWQGHLVSCWGLYSACL